MLLDIFQHRISWAFKEYPPFLSWTIRKRTIFRTLIGACFVGHPVSCLCDRITKTWFGPNWTELNLSRNLSISQLSNRAKKPTISVTWIAEQCQLGKNVWQTAFRQMNPGQTVHGQTAPSQKPHHHKEYLDKHHEIKSTQTNSTQSNSTQTNSK